MQMMSGLGAVADVPFGSLKLQWLDAKMETPRAISMEITAEDELWCADTENRLEEHKKRIQ